MRIHTPEISWHNRLPTLSLDIAAAEHDNQQHYKLATGGNDCRVYIWTINPKNLQINIRAGLRRHQKSVGAVRFSNQHLLASGDDDGYIYLWKQKIDGTTQQVEQQLAETANTFLNDDGFEDAELWQHYKVLRGHIEDICDLTWSKDGKFLLSGSVDNSAILWDAIKGTKIWCSDLIKGYVQGVAIDPHSQFMAAFSTDRTLRIYNFNDRRLLSATRRMNIKSKFKAFFCDDTVQTFCRRFEFSPDGQFLVVPTTRLVEQEQAPKQQACVTIGEEGEVHEQEQQQQEQPTHQPSKPINVFLVFKRHSLNKPLHYYTTSKEPALCIRFSPVVYKLRDTSQNFWDIPYRMVFAVATSRSVIIYDSQQPYPIAYISQIHLARLTDLSWSSDGLMLMISSYDGYTSIVLFDKNEIGDAYTGPLIEPVQKKEKEETPPQPAPIPPPKPQPPKETFTIRKYLIKRS